VLYNKILILQYIILNSFAYLNVLSLSIFHLIGVI